MTFHFSNDVFRLNLTFESTERILQGFALLQSNFCHAHPPSRNSATRFLIAERFAQSVVRALSPRKPAHANYSPRWSPPGSFAAPASSALIDKRCLLGRMFAQFSHLVDAAGNSLFLFSLIPAFCFIPLSLLPRLFLLALCVIHPRQVFGRLTGRTLCIRKKLPARFARLPWMAAIVVAPTAASTPKTMASAPRTFRLRLGLVDGQRASA